MEIGKLIEKCCELPGISVIYDKEDVCLKYNDKNDIGYMKFIQVFEGVTLAYIEIDAFRWPAPALDEISDLKRGPFIINYCVEGRCELLLNDDNYVYVTDKQISLSENYAMNNYIYPGHMYHGLELFIDLENAVKNDFLSEVFDIDLKAIAKRYCSDSKTYIAASSPDIANEFNALWELYKQDEFSYSRMKAYVLSVLVCLSQPMVIGRKVPGTFYTKAQVAIAKDVERILTSDISIHHSAKELAKMYAISESSLKNYFRGVYGKNISEYMNKFRMQKAADLLENTDESILEIGEQVGYQNQSKFAAAFRKYYEMTPRQYRIHKKYLNRNT